MRKTGTLVIAVILVTSLIGYSQGMDGFIESESVVPTSSFSAGEIQKPHKSSGKPAGSVNSGILMKQTERSSAGELVQPINADEIKGGSESSSVSASSKKQTKKKQPKKSAKPKKKAKKKKKSKKKKTAYDAPYNTSKIIADAKAYGKSIGMTWSEPLTKDNCSWEAPGATSPTLSGKRLKKAIRSSIKRIKKLQKDNGYQPGEFHFKVLLESAGGGEYAIYFLMG
jgi:hypothetical protein